MSIKPLLSAILVIDELPFLAHLPWKSAIHSVLRFADEMVVVHGGKTRTDGSRHTLDYLHSLHDDRIRISTFPWKDDFDWRQIAQTCTFGHLKASGLWCFRVLADEVFTHDFDEFPTFLRSLPADKTVISVNRLYMLGHRYACAFHDKPLFFRNDRRLGYGTINVQQGPAASQLLFDDPLDCEHVSINGKIVTVDNPIIQDPQGAARLLAGEVPYGYRDLSERGLVRIDKGVLNVDVNYFPDELLLDQKDLSQEAYQRLPPEYPHRERLTRAQLRTHLIAKLRNMIEYGRLCKITPPADMLEFIDQQEPVHNLVRSLCETTYGLPWNRYARQHSRWRCQFTLASNHARRIRQRWARG